MKEKIFVIFISLAFVFNAGYAQEELEKDYQKVVVNFINCIKTDNIEELAKLIDFPWVRNYPIPSIKNKDELKVRYNEIFDDSLKQMIITSNPSTDWSSAGWRGVMLNRGVLYLDTEGKIRAINYQSKVEKELKEKYTVIDKKNLHKSLLPFDFPVYLLETKDYRIRIDAMGNDNYRFAMWDKKSKMTEKPKLVITNGKIVYEGNSSNHSYQFKNENLTYICSIIYIGPIDCPPAIYSINKADKEIFTQDAIIIRN
jgi:hypothetical protein